MGKCDICGREQNKLHTLKQLHLCNKHYSQYQQHGKFLDNNPRTTYDLNDIISDGNIAKIILRDASQNIIGEAIIDKEDVVKVKPYKWRLKKEVQREASVMVFIQAMLKTQNVFLCIDF